MFTSLFDDAVVKVVFVKFRVLVQKLDWRSCNCVLNVNVCVGLVICSCEAFDVGRIEASTCSTERTVIWELDHVTAMYLPMHAVHKSTFSSVKLCTGVHTSRISWRS